MTREVYRKLPEQEESLPFFMQPWWLDVSCGPDHWDAVTIENGGVIQAALPYLRKSKLGVRVISQPTLTQFLGPWIRETGGKSTTVLARQKDLMSELVEGLPEYDYYSQNWSPEITNWLPFYWKGFTQTTRYTYVLRNLQDTNALWDNIAPKIRTDIRKAANRYRLHLKPNPSLDHFLDINEMTFNRQGKKPPYSREFIRKLDAECHQRNCRRILIAEDDGRRSHAAVYVVWDKRTAYYLMGGGNPELRSSGATSLCLWEAIQHASGIVDNFDFEGSMMEPVERFVRAFGAIQTPLFNVQRSNSTVGRLASFMKKVA